MRSVELSREERDAERRERKVTNRLRYQRRYARHPPIMVEPRASVPVLHLGEEVRAVGGETKRGRFSMQEKTQMASELDDALRLADKLLDAPMADPDDDLRMLSRQLRRQNEVYERYKLALTRANGYLIIQGLEPVKLEYGEPDVGAKPDGMVDEELQEAMLNPATQVMFRAGLLACREYMAAFVASENPNIAASIRANWWPFLGADPGRPRRLHWNDVYVGEYPDGRAKTKAEVSPSIEALVQAMMFLHSRCGWPMSHECFGESASTVSAKP